MKKLVIAIDFDGTVVENKFPYVGDSLGAEAFLKALVANGHKLILHTSRSGAYLLDAQEWFAKKGIELYGVNENPDFNNPGSKLKADLYIDDKSLGAPLDDEGHIDWEIVEEMFELS